MDRSLFSDVTVVLQQAGTKEPFQGGQRKRHYPEDDRCGEGRGLLYPEGDQERHYRRLSHANSTGNGHYPHEEIGARSHEQRRPVTDVCSDGLEDQPLRSPRRSSR